MTRPGFDPARRSRNIGTAKQGHGDDNRLVVPIAWSDRRELFARLNSPTFIEIEVAGSPRTFAIERTRNDSVHAATVDDIVHLLSYVDPEHIDGLEIFILRQPTRKQQTIDGAWGRLRYCLELGKKSAAAMIIEAVEAKTIRRFSRAMSLDEAAELNRFRKAGVTIRSDARKFEAVLDLADARELLLYRTVLHEVGHYVDYLQSVRWPSANATDDDWELWDRFWQRPSAEREVAAHRYADAFGAGLRSQGCIPFDRMDDPQRLISLGLNVTDFHF